MMEEAQCEFPAFKKAEKKYKLKKENPKDKKKKKNRQQEEFPDVIDFLNLDHNTEANRAKIVSRGRPNLPGLPDNAEVFELVGADGLIFIRNALSPQQQLWLAGKCCREYSNLPYNNLTNLYGPQPDLWVQALEQADFTTMRKLRWSNLGFNYRWTEREYGSETKEEKSESGFPEDLAALIRPLAQLSGYDMVPEAGIVNYYPLDGSMGGHIDDAEHDLTKPVVSISLARSAIFLMGGPTRDIEPAAMFVRSGDVVVMGGYSRTCFHGVPRILEETPDFFQPQNLVNYPDLEPDMPAVLDFCSTYRFNINVRQVRIGREKLNESV